MNIRGLAAALALASADASALVDLDGIVDISAGPGYACALTSAGGVKCWGSNASGQLGDGTNTHRSLATRVSGLSSGVSSISAGHGHACVVTNDGAVKCWGANDSGQLGNGGTTSSNVPVSVNGLASGVASVSAGGSHTCAVTIAGAVKCWGSNGKGELGDTSTTQRTEPVDVSGLAGGIATVAATEQHTCALTTAGGMLCWGANESGQLGDGTTTPRSIPGDVTGLTTGVVSIATGRGPDSAGSLLLPDAGGGTSCAVLTSGAAWCWGNNVAGELGVGDKPSDRLLPAQVQGLTSGATAITVGSTGGCSGTTSGTHPTQFVHRTNHACVSMTGGGVKCWGGNTRAELGSTLPEVYSGSCQAGFILGVNYYYGESLVPVDATVLGGPVTVIAAGSGTNCAVDTAGKVKCWGARFSPASGYDATPAFVQTTESGLTPQVITLGPKPTVPVGGTGTITATGGQSTSPIVFTSLTPDVCTVSGSTITGVANDRCTIAANQAGDVNYDPALQVTITFLVGPKLQQTVTFGPLPVVAAFTYSTIIARASSGLPVTFGSAGGPCNVQMGAYPNGISATLAALDAGTCTVAAVQYGDEFYAASPLVTADIVMGAPNGPSASVSLTQTRLTASPEAGKDIVYAISVTNQGPATTSLILSSVLPKDVAFIWGNPSCGESSGIVTCQLGAFGPGGTTQAKVVVRPATAGSLTHLVAVVGSVPIGGPGATDTVAVATTPEGTPIQRYRLYSNVTKEHHFTTDLNEYNTLGSYVGTWVQEGTVGKVLDNPGSFNGVAAVPYYRLYDTSTQWHHWTTDANEFYTLGFLYPGWNMEGVSGWILPTAVAGTTQLYRLNYPALGSLHHWTIDANEYNTLINDYGWVGEGGSGFVVQ